MVSYKEKWVRQGIDEGYLSAMAQMLVFIAVQQNNDIDEFIVEFELKRKDFLLYLDEKDIEEIDEVVDGFPSKVREIWMK